ncbi:hypothetical protein AB0K48_28350, partial [Nonomuraea sp. NPDC055795]
MRKIVAGLFVSLDGVVEAPDKWHFPYVNDEMTGAVMAQQQGADTLLLGRATYEVFASSWPHRSDPMADHLNNVRKLGRTEAVDRHRAQRDRGLQRDRHAGVH